MATIVQPSGDTTGVTDAAAINAALLSDDVTLLEGRYYYVKADAVRGVAIKVPQNRTLQGQSASNKSYIKLVGTDNATGYGYVISQEGNGNARGVTLKNLYLHGGRMKTLYTPSAATISFTSGTNTITSSSLNPLLYGFQQGMSIKVGGTVSNNGVYTISSVTSSTIVVAQNLTTEAAAAGAYLYETGPDSSGAYYNGGCIAFASHLDYGSNNLVITDVECFNGAVQGIAINSVDGVAFTRVTSTADRNPVQSGHGNDFDTVVYDIATTNVSWVDSTLDMYGQESVKYENVDGATHTNCNFGSYVTIAPDLGDPYSYTDNISFTNCTFTSWAFLGATKRRHVPGGSQIDYTPTMALTLTSAGVSTGSTAGVTITAASGTPFATTIFGGTGPVGKMITATSGQINGAAIITGRTSDTVVTATIINKFASTTINANTWMFSDSDNGSAGRVTFTNCTFNGEDACIFGGDNYGINYGAVTVTGCTFNGRNSIVFPTAYQAFRPTITNCTGINPSFTLWIRNTVNPKYVNIYGPAGAFPTVIQSLGQVSFASPITSLASPIYDGYDFTNARITAMNDTYVSTKFVGVTNGNVNLPFSFESETPYGAIIDGTGFASSFIGLSGTNNKLVKISGFYIKNFTGGSSSRGIMVNNAAAVGEITGNYFYNCSSTTGGGGGIRVQNAQSAFIHKNTFEQCSGTTSGNGGAVLVDVVNCSVKSNYFYNCAVAPGGTGVLRLNGSVAGTTLVSGNVFVGSTGTNAVAVAISVSSSTAGVTFNVFNNSIYGSTSGVTFNDVGIFVSNATTTCNFSNNIAYSSGTTNSVAKTGGGIINYGNNCTATAFSVASGTNNNLGGNITTNPAFTSLTTLTINTSSPCYETGVSNLPQQSSIVDFYERPFVLPYSMGAYGLKTSGYLSSTRSSSTSRSTTTSTRSTPSVTRTTRTVVL